MTGIASQAGPGIDRRSVIRLATALSALWLASAHTPYEQWVVYRKRVLLIGGSRDDPIGYALAQRVADTLLRELPESRARPSRAPNAERLASLIATDQLDVAVLPWSDAVALVRGDLPFDAIGEVPLTALRGLDTHVLVCRADFPDPHAYLVARTLDEAWGPAADGAGPVSTAATEIPVHPGARAHLMGRPAPALDAPTVADHVHAPGPDD